MVLLSLENIYNNSMRDPGSCELGLSPISGTILWVISTLRGFFPSIKCTRKLPRLMTMVMGNGMQLGCRMTPACSFSTSLYLCSSFQHLLQISETLWFFPSALDTMVFFWIWWNDASLFWSQYSLLGISFSIFILHQHTSCVDFHSTLMLCWLHTRGVWRYIESNQHS